MVKRIQKREKIERNMRSGIRKILIFGSVILITQLSFGDVFRELPEEDQAAMGIDDIINKRDPFKVPSMESILEGRRMKTELEQYALEELRVKAILSGPGEYRAMILVPSNKTFFVRKNDRIGLRDGVISKITSDSVYVIEQETDFFGRDRAVTARMDLPEQKSLLISEAWVGDSRIPENVGLPVQRTNNPPGNQAPSPQPPRVKESSSAALTLVSFCN